MSLMPLDQVCTNPIIGNHVYVNNWFDNKYRERSDSRWPSFRIAINWALQHHTGGPFHIVETGCVRQLNDFGAGYSTVMFADLCKNAGFGRVWTIDISERNLAVCRTILEKEGLSDRVTLWQSDSVKALETLASDHPAAGCGGVGSVNILYLDSYDYPLKPEDGPTGPPQDHCLAELKAASPLFNDNTVVLLDDNNLPGGGKPRLAKLKLEEWGWTCLFDYQQSVWIRK